MSGGIIGDFRTFPASSIAQLIRLAPSYVIVIVRPEGEPTAASFVDRLYATSHDARWHRASRLVRPEHNSWHSTLQGRGIDGRHGNLESNHHHSKQSAHRKTQ